MFPFSYIISVCIHKEKIVNKIKNNYKITFILFFQKVKLRLDYTILYAIFLNFNFYKKTIQKLFF